jgi:hypothetical protein
MRAFTEHRDPAALIEQREDGLEARLEARLAARLEALRAGLGSSTFPDLSIEGPELFDRFAVKQDNDVMAVRQDLPSEAVPAEEMAPGDLRVAKMVQDMASFGYRAGEGDLRARAQDGNRFEYYA